MNLRWSKQKAQEPLSPSPKVSFRMFQNNTFFSFKKWELISRINKSLFVSEDLDSDKIMNEGAGRPCKLYSTTISNHITKKSYAIGVNEIYAYIRT